MRYFFPRQNKPSIPISFLIFTFAYFWLCWVFIAAHGLSLVVVSRGCSPAAVHRLLTGVASACFSSYSASASLPCSMWNLPRPVIKPGSPPLECVCAQSLSCVQLFWDLPHSSVQEYWSGRQILNHWTTKEILSVSFFILLSFVFCFALPVGGYFQPPFHWECSPLWALHRGEGSHFKHPATGTSKTLIPVVFKLKSSAYWD